MNKRWIVLMIAASVLLFALFVVMPVSAETSSITYEGNVNDGHFTFAPGTTYSPTDMFLAMDQIHLDVQIDSTDVF